MSNFLRKVERNQKRNNGEFKKKQKAKKDARKRRRG